MAILAGALTASGCTALNAVPKPVLYRLARADTDARENFHRGLAQLRAEDHQGALESFNRALWDLEQIEKDWLRLPELAAVHQALGDTYSGLRRTDWAAEHRALSMALVHRGQVRTAGALPERSLLHAKHAYQAARFQEAGAALTAALVDLQDLTHPPARLRSLEEARCYQVLVFVALDQEDRARDELRRLWALDPTFTFCRSQAPPAVRLLIHRVQRRTG